jgi:uncharacterized protein YndB with AHSA1/START domain
MISTEKTSIKVQTIIDAPIEKVWKHWITPEDIINWNNASDDWHTTHAENDLQVGGKFNYRMEAKNADEGFNFRGVYQKVILLKQIEYIIEDRRKVKIDFFRLDKKTKIVETFEAEDNHAIEMQFNGWQSILNNFKKYVESK